MSDKGLFDLARAWVDHQATKLETRTRMLQDNLENPTSAIDRRDQPTPERFQSREAKRDQLETYRRIREDGGIIMSLLEARSLMVFGTGGEYTAENDEVADWLNEQIPNQDLLRHDLGLDCYTYGYALTEIVETNAGDFGDLVCIEPWTTIPIIGRKGKVQRWDQKVELERGKDFEQTFSTDEVQHWKVMKKSGRDPVGMSFLGRAMDEAKSYRDNQRAIRNAVRLHAFPKWHIKVGREDGPVIDDSELRRVRPMFDDITELTKWVTGPDVEIDPKQAESFEIGGITEHDLSKLAIAFMMPVELTQLGGGEGLGSGFPAKVRKAMFLLSAKAHQGMLGSQLVDLGEHLIDEYSPFTASEVEIGYHWEEPITDLDEMKSKVDAIGDDMTVNERREMFDLSPLEEEEGEQYISPAEEARQEAGGDAGPGLFSEEPSRHRLARERDDFWWEDYLAEAADRTWHTDDKRLFSFSEGATPEFVKNRLFDAVMQGSPIFSDLETIPSDRLMDLRMFMAEKLTQDGWTITEMRDQLVSEFGVDKSNAETIARSSTQNMVSEAAEAGYRSRDDFDQLRFDWSGPSDHRTTDICMEIKEQVPDEGLHLDELKELVQEVADEHDLNARGWTSHPNCRHRPVRIVN